MVSFFGGKEKSGGSAASAERIPRNSSGWGKILERMRGEESLRVLDVGPTSSGNINFITSLGHSIYLANLVEDASRKEWTPPQPDGTPGPFDVDRFLSTHLTFSGRGFDIVLLWDTADYLPEPIVAPVLRRLHDVMEPNGQMLAMFHSASTTGSSAQKADFSRYHLTDSSKLDVQRAGDYPLTNTFTNRQIETLLEDFKSFTFFLSKDNVREVLITR
jgi:hypothetical protein